MTYRAFLIGSVFFLLFISFAEAAKYECERVDTIARLGTLDGDRVTIEEGNKDKKTEGKYCAFSVEGVAASSPPSDLIKGTLDRLSTPIRSGVREDVWIQRANDVAVILIAASDLQEPPDALVDIMKRNLETLKKCYRNYYDAAPMSDEPAFFEGGSFSRPGFCYFTELDYYGLTLDGDIRAIHDDNDLRATAFSLIVGNPQNHLLIAVVIDGISRYFVQPYNRGR